MKKILTLLSVIVILIAGCSTEQPVQVTTEAVKLADGELTLTHEGIISLSDEIEVRSPISGNLVEKFVENGTDVTEGQLLLKVSEFGPHADLLQLKTELAKAKTDLAKALATNDESAAELQAELERIQTEVKKLDDFTANGLIYAPKSGRLGAIDAPLGMLVTADETVVASIGNINPLAVRFEVSKEEARLLSASDNLKATLIFDNGKVYPVEGVINFVDDSTAEAVFDNSDGLLLLGMNVKIELSGLNVANVLLIPTSAVQERDGDNFVYVAENNKAAVKKILLGDKLGTYYIVKDGLKSGDSVVVDGLTNLREGTPLKLGNRE